MGNTPFLGEEGVGRGGVFFEGLSRKKSPRRGGERGEKSCVF